MIENLFKPDIFLYKKLNNVPTTKSFDHLINGIANY